MIQYHLLIFVSVFAIQTDGFSVAKCWKPRGMAGDVIVDGCRKRTCTAITVRKGVWFGGPSM